MGIMRDIVEFILRTKECEKVEVEEEMSYTKPEQVKVNRIQPEIIAPICRGDYSKEKPSLLVLDDQVGVVNTVIGELEEIEGIDIHEEFNVLASSGKYAAFGIEKFMSEPACQNIQLAFVDITLGGIIDGIEYDGIDVAKELKKNNPHCEVYFLTGHTMNSKVSVIFDYVNKFKDYFGSDIDELEIENGQEKYVHIIPKSSNRLYEFTNVVKKFLQGRANELHNG